MKKLFFTLCALCLCGTMWGQNIDETTGLYYTLDESNNATIVAVEGVTYGNDNLVSYTGDEATNALTLPATVGDNYPVTDVAAKAFDGATISGHLVIPANILNLYGLAFNGCTGLTTVTFEYSATPLVDKNTTLYESSFYGCDNVTVVYLNRDVTASGTGAFTPFAYVEGVETVYIGENVTYIPHHMFRCNRSYVLKYVYSDAATPPEIDSTVFEHHNTGTFVFYTKYDYLNAYRLDDTWLAEFGRDNMHAYDSDTDPDWPEDVNAFQDENGLWYDPIEDTEYECVLIADQGGEVYEGTITIPETVLNSNDGNTYTVTRIDSHAFANSSIEGIIIIPSNILSIGESAFENCTGLTTVTFEYSSEALVDENTANGTGGYMFNGCSQVSTVNLYRNVSASTNDRLSTPFCYNTGVATINIGPRVTNIPGYFFRCTASTLPLKEINCYGANPPSLGTGVFNPNSECVINVPQGSETDYSASWSDYYTGTYQGVLSNAYAVTISEAAALDGSYYATYYNENAVDIYPQGGTLSDGSVYDVTTYAATGVEVDGTTAYLDLAEVGATVPAGVAVLVDGNVAGTYTVIETTAAKSASYSGTNDLYGFVYDEETEEYVAVAPDAGSYYFYKLTLDSDNDSNSLGFYWGAEEGGTFTGEANKAYLVLTQGALQGLSAVKLKKGEGEDTTGITSVEVENETNTVKGIYTVQGIRVSNMNQPGLYIVDGKKVLVK